MRDFIFNLEPRQADPSGAARPQAARGVRVRDRPRRDRADRLARVRYAWSTIVPPATPPARVAQPELQPLPFDTDPANRSWTTLGYAKGADGIRIANGHPDGLRGHLPDDEAGAGDRAFRIIQHGFEQIGVEVTQKPLDTTCGWDAMYSDRQLHTTLRSRDVGLVPGRRPGLHPVRPDLRRSGAAGATRVTATRSTTQLYEEQGSRSIPRSASRSFARCKSRSCSTTVPTSS